MAKPKILAVDDEVFNLDIILDYLQKAGYEVIAAKDGMVALEMLEKHSDISVIVLDRMMPGLNGMELLAKIKADIRFKDIPVIMQTAAASSEQILEGINAGVYYYLTKPYEDVMLLSIVKSALTDAIAKNSMKAEVHNQKRALGLMQQASFKIRTLEEAQNLAYFIASCTPKPETAVYGINELLVNAIEHGNLGMSYAEKTYFVRSGTWHEEVKRRLEAPENSNKFATVTFTTIDDTMKITVKDQGAGFNWQEYLTMSPNRATDPNGRGIAIAVMMSFSNIEYLGCGNEVVATIDIK